MDVDASYIKFSAVGDWFDDAPNKVSMNANGIFGAAESDFFSDAMLRKNARVRPGVRAHVRASARKTARVQQMLNEM